MEDEFSLQNLHDIVMPDGPALWPPAPGFWIACALLLLAVSLIVARAVAARRRSAYRRAGLELLAAAASVRDVSVILKRVALAAFPREEVASLYGTEWQEFLERSCPGLELPALAQDEGAMAPDEALLAAAARWIRRHRVTERRALEA